MRVAGDRGCAGRAPRLPRWNRVAGPGGGAVAEEGLALRELPLPVGAAERDLAAHHDHATATAVLDALGGGVLDRVGAVVGEVAVIDEVLLRDLQVVGVDLAGGGAVGPGPGVGGHQPKGVPLAVGGELQGVVGVPQVNTDLDAYLICGIVECTPALNS